MNFVKKALGVGVVLSTGLTVACGADEPASSAGTGDPSGLVVEVSMTDMAYEPSSFAFEVGQTVTFRFRNDGQVAHEAYIDDEAGQEAHGTSMTGMEGHDMGEEGLVVVQPGEVRELTHTFDDEGDLELGCHQPGHYEADMKAVITVG